MKTNLILLAVFVVLLPLCIVQFVSARRSFTDISTVPKLFEGFNPDRVAIVVLEKPKADAPAVPTPGPDQQPKVPSDQIAFERTNNDWVIYGERNPLRGVKVRGNDVRSRILEPLGKIKLTKGSVVDADATDVELEEKGLDPKKAIRVQLADSNRQFIAHLLIGSEASKGQYGTESVSGTFVMRVDETKPTKQIILSDERFYLDVTEDAWVDKQVLSLDQGKVKSIELTNPKGKLVLERGEDKKWVAKEPSSGVGALKEYEVTSLLGRVSNLDVSKYLDPIVPGMLKAHNLDPAETLVTIKTDDSKEHRIRIGGKIPDKNDYYAAVDGVNFLVSLGEWNVTPYQKDPKDFFEPVASQPADTRPSETKSTDSKPASGDTPATKSSGDGK